MWKTDHTVVECLVLLPYRQKVTCSTLVVFLFRLVFMFNPCVDFSRFHLQFKTTE